VARGVARGYRESWDERVPIHASGGFYDVASFKAGQERLQPFEVEEVGDVSGKDLLHLQCHFGMDTLSWARRGARVAGLDFSAPAVEAARSLASDLGLEATFVRSDVYEAAEALEGRSFDVVYTGRGALNWLPDLGRLGRGGRRLGAPRGVPLPVRVPPLHGGLRGRGPDGGARLLPRGGAAGVGRTGHLRRPRCRDAAQPHLRVEPPLWARWSARWSPPA
jgi:SAM-dependent methyltransferase